MKYTTAKITAEDVPVESSVDATLRRRTCREEEMPKYTSSEPFHYGASSCAPPLDRRIIQQLAGDQLSLLSGESYNNIDNIARYLFHESKLSVCSSNRRMLSGYSSSQSRRFEPREKTFSHSLTIRLSLVSLFSLSFSVPRIHKCRYFDEKSLRAAPSCRNDRPGVHEEDLPCVPLSFSRSVRFF